jgi:hypothetical protein
METALIKKRLSTFMSPKGYLASVSNEVAVEVLRGWESWAGPGAQYAKELGISASQLGTMIQKGKRLIKNGIVTESEFKEIGVSASTGLLPSSTTCAIELQVDANRLVRFGQVDTLVEFLKKTST